MITFVTPSTMMPNKTYLVVLYPQSIPKLLPRIPIRKLELEFSWLFSSPPVSWSVATPALKTWKLTTSCFKEEQWGRPPPPRRPLCSGTDLLPRPLLASFLCESSSLIHNMISIYYTQFALLWHIILDWLSEGILPNNIPSVWISSKWSLTVFFISDSHHSWISLHFCKEFPSEVISTYLKEFLFKKAFLFEGILVFLNIFKSEGFFFRRTIVGRDTFWQPLDWLDWKQKHESCILSFSLRSHTE